MNASPYNIWLVLLCIIHIKDTYLSSNNNTIYNVVVVLFFNIVYQMKMINVRRILLQLNFTCLM